MLLDVEYGVWGGAPVDAFAAVAEPTPPQWSIILPFFNEAAYLRSTLGSLAGQASTAVVILVDNGSTDQSSAIALAACRDLGLNHKLVVQPVPGKVHALSAGLEEVKTCFVATCDADTWYPPHYLMEAERLLERPGCAAAGAFYVAPGPGPEDLRRRGAQIACASWLLPHQSHTGGAGQAFRTAALRAAGGFDPQRWNYVLEDHEIIHRVMRFGSMRYAEALWCIPSQRERNRESIRWTLFERLMYSAAAPLVGDWFFYRFLAGRLQKRQLTSVRIRERPFQNLEGRPSGAAYFMC